MAVSTYTYDACLTRSRSHCPGPADLTIQPHPPTSHAMTRGVPGTVSSQPEPTGNRRTWDLALSAYIATWTPTRSPDACHRLGCNAHSSTIPASSRCGVPSSPHPSSLWIRSRGAGSPRRSRCRSRSSRHWSTAIIAIAANLARVVSRARFVREALPMLPACSTTTWARPATRPARLPTRLRGDRVRSQPDHGRRHATTSGRALAWSDCSCDAGLPEHLVTTLVWLNPMPTLAQKENRISSLAGRCAGLARRTLHVSLAGLQNQDSPRPLPVVPAVTSSSRYRSAACRPNPGSTVWSSASICSTRTTTE